ncbi:hypothetical protein [uncultured Mediterranean phage uvMED]|nr:hypothetical protein [uncultured Mediterranean phage uvMED]
MDLKTQILVALGLDTKEEVSNEETNLSFQAKLVDGTIIVSEDDVLAEGSLVNVLTEDGTTMPLPVGEYQTEDNLSFVIAEEGIVESLTEGEAPAEDEEEVTEEVAPELSEEEETPEVTEETELDEEVTEEVLEEEVAEEIAPEVAPSPKTITTTTTEKVEFNKDEFLAEINDSIVALKSEIETLKTENVDLKAQLNESATAPVNVNKFSKDTKTLSSKELSRMTRQERFLYNLTK